jgi:hypothetical protein
MINYGAPEMRWLTRRLMRRSTASIVDGGCLMRGEWPARWEPQEEDVMSIAASFPSVKKPRYVDLGEERQTTEGDADWLNSTPTRAPFNDTCWLVFDQ